MSIYLGRGLRFREQVCACRCTMAFLQSGERGDASPFRRGLSTRRAQNTPPSLCPSPFLSFLPSILPASLPLDWQLAALMQWRKRCSGVTLQIMGAELSDHRPKVLQVIPLRGDQGPSASSPALLGSCFSCIYVCLTVCNVPPPTCCPLFSWHSRPARLRTSAPAGCSRCWEIGAERSDKPSEGALIFKMKKRYSN